MVLDLPVYIESMPINKWIVSRNDKTIQIISEDLVLQYCLTGLKRKGRCLQ